MTGRGVLFSLILVALLSGAAEAWTRKDHRRLASIAIEHCPPELAAFLRENVDEVLQGCVDPDQKFFDTPNHTYHVDDGTRSSPEHVAYLASALVSMMRNGAPREKVAYWFGALSHYVSDIDQPLHTSDRDKKEKVYHVLFEGMSAGFEKRVEVPGATIDFKVGRVLSDWQFRFDGAYDPIDDVEAWQIGNAKWAHRYYDEIRGNFTGRCVFDAERLAQIFRTCLSEAANDVIDLWAWVYRTTGARPDELARAGGVLFIEVDKKGRPRLDGERIREASLRERLRAHAAGSSAAGDDPRRTPVAYIEIDDRCDERKVERVEELCRDAGIEEISTVLLTKGPLTSRLFRFAKFQAASLAARSRGR